jgi:protein-S-isoprenylcysteine O-methyltransferase Ste14
MPLLTLFLLIATLAAEWLAAAAVAWSARFPGRRIWPPPAGPSWPGYGVPALFFLSGAGVVALGIADWGSLGLPLWAHLAAGGLFGLAGNGLALWAIVALGVARSLGDTGPIVQRGPYRFSRNPQYVGFIASLWGWTLLAGSALTLAAAAAGTVALVLAPFAEEPWLRERYGPAYEAYLRAVPRFLPLGVFHRSGKIVPPPERCS